MLSSRETEIAQEIAKLDNFKVVQFEEYHEQLTETLHPNHYLMVLLKRHMIGLYSASLSELEAKDLERVSVVYRFMIVIDSKGASKLYIPIGQNSLSIVNYSSSNQINNLHSSMFNLMSNSFWTVFFRCDVISRFGIF